MWRALLLVSACGRVSFGEQLVCDPPSVLDRSARWTPGATAGSSVNNPGPTNDGMVWSYEWVSGGALDATDAWYRGLAQPLTWDDDWFGQGGGWTFANDVPPMVTAAELTQDLQWNHIGLIRLTNVSTQIVQVRASGVLRVLWRGFAGPTPAAVPVDVDVVFAALTADREQRATLIAATVAKPTATPALEEAAVELARDVTVLEPGDSLAFSARPSGQSDANAWITIIDDNLTIELAACR